jgi:hypothetical protein
LQVVTSNFASVFSTTSSGLTSTGHSVTITPKFSTSKILVLNTAIVSTSNQNSWGYFSSIYRGATNLATTAGGVGTPAAFAAIYSSSTASATQTITMQYLDSPATTSATTYTIYIGGGGATIKYSTDSWYGSTPPSVLTVLEIAA